MKILILSDAWLPQVNGVVRTLQATCRELEKMGHVVKVVGPDTTAFMTFALPSYAEIVLEFFPGARLLREIKAFDPDTLHIATEGPLGWSARHLCMKNKWQFTTAYHTRFPQYFAARAPYGLRLLTEQIAYFVLRIFHRRACVVMAATASIVQDLKNHGFQNVVVWSRGVDTDLFTLYGKGFVPYLKMPRPILLYVGRVSMEKNLADFLCLQTNGSKVVIGSGPDQEKLSADFPDAHFLGRMEGETLAKAYAAADLFVFPSKSDTFGLVLLEACAAGLRIAAYPVAGPKDVFSEPDTGCFVVLDPCLQQAVDQALLLPESPQAPRKFAERHAWGAATAQFCAHLCPLIYKKEQK